MAGWISVNVCVDDFKSIPLKAAGANGTNLKSLFYPFLPIGWGWIDCRLLA
jgi:hypothetical protein